MSTTRLIVLGMRSNLCREAIVSALHFVGGVHEAQVNLFRGSAVVHHHSSCQAAELMSAIHRAGYLAILQWKAG